MRIHEIVIVPGVGHSADDGTYCRGHDIGSVAEIDVIDKYVAAIVDELDGEGMRNKVMGTRRAPGIKIGERHLGIMPNTLVLHCRIGWHANHKKVTLESNYSVVAHSTEDSRPLAGELSEIISHWGGLYSFGHKARMPKDNYDQLLTIPNTLGIRIEPFVLNGPDVKEYLVRLHMLGHDVGRFLAGYLKGRDFAIAAQRSSLTF